MQQDEVPDSVRAAVERGLSRQQRDALTEVDQILDAALRVAERVAPVEPRVADIVAEAGTSNQTFYRYFPGKHDLLLAVAERGLVRVRGYLATRMARQAEPADQVVAWVEGLLAQVTRPGAARQSTAVMRPVVLAGRLREAAGLTLLDQLGALLVAPLTTLGRPEPDLDARVLQDVVLGTLQRHVVRGTTPTAAECDHLVRFCVHATTAG
ncbi:TetR/AcrR family transcriptional regulator [uncultured Modestobacter sp.]|uniref:TetR/AcrR family transcriptional regulator n=1 Tax=uncultured Modestobacter sp. TaxID=380048 RepID=UPI002613B532|nr:TetR/AcrR family transcriptional regulator [uncultured Modestobacter sp.]